VRIFPLIAGALIVSSGCATPSNPPVPLAERLGEAVALEGIAENRKFGAALKGEGFDVWIGGVARWPSGLASQRLRVTGVLEERFDLPVYAVKPGEPAAGGIPVPEGTDLREASRRYVIRDARWSLIR
jgi:hypothetical protein